MGLGLSTNVRRSQINPNQEIRLTVETTVSRVLETTALGGTVLAPTTTKRFTNSTISVMDGETAVIGGLIESAQNRGKTQTPCLGGIPGRLRAPVHLGLHRHPQQYRR